MRVAGMLRDLGDLCGGIDLLQSDNVETGRSLGQVVEPVTER